MGNLEEKSFDSLHEKTVVLKKQEQGLNDFTQLADWKPRPELSEPAKSVRKRVFYFVPVAFLVLISEPNKDNLIQFFGFSIPYDHALSAIFLMLIYLLFHFSYEIWRDFEDNRDKWAGSTYELTSVGLYIGRQVQMTESLATTIQSIKNVEEEMSVFPTPIWQAGDERQHLKNYEESAAFRFEKDYLSRHKNMEHALSAIKNKTGDTAPQEYELDFCLSDLNESIDDFGKIVKEKRVEVNEKYSRYTTDISRLYKKYEREYKFIEDYRKTLDIQISTLQKETDDFVSLKNNFFPSLKAVAHKHKWKFRGFIVIQWLFEVIFPYVILLFLAVWNSSPSIIYDTFGMLKHMIYSAKM